MGRAIAHQLFPDDREMQVIGLDGQLDHVLASSFQTGSMEPMLAETLLAGAQQAVARQEQVGLPPVLVVQPKLRTLLARFLRRSLPQLSVLSFNEIPDSRTVRITSTIGG